jgi:thymidylate synthase
VRDGKLDLMMAIRSWDLGLGGSFNIAQYALLTHLLARATGLKAGRLLINYGDAHVYENHVKLLYDHMQKWGPMDDECKLVINTANTDIDGYKIEDFEITGYKSGPFLKLPIAV